MTARQSAAVDRALALVAQGMTPYRAAKIEGIALSTIYRAQKRQVLRQSIDGAKKRRAKTKA
jgi:transposase